MEGWHTEKLGVQGVNRQAPATGKSMKGHGERKMEHDDII